MARLIVCVLPVPGATSASCPCHSGHGPHGIPGTRWIIKAGTGYNGGAMVSPLMSRGSPRTPWGLKALTALALMAFLGVPVLVAPRVAAFEVILVRHADKDRERGDYNLSPAGFRRAVNLARLIPACFGVPAGIITYLLDPLTSKNARSYQSAVPLAVATGAPIRIAMQSAEGSEQIGRQLRAEHASRTDRLVLFWEHRRMPDLARGLGWPEMAAIADDDFDQLVVLRYRRSSSSPQVLTYRQSRLLQWPCFRNATLPWDLPQSLPAARRTP